MAACVSVLAASCASATSGLPSPPATVALTMREYRFDFEPDVPSGRVVFDVANAGAADHALTLIRLPEDYPPIDAQLHSDERRPAATLARVPATAPGGGSHFAVDLVPGRYAMVCFVTDADGVIHGLKGMNAEFRVT